MQTRLLKTKNNKAYELTVVAKNMSEFERFLKKVSNAYEKSNADIHPYFTTVLSPVTNNIEFYFYGKDKELKNFKKFLDKHVI